MASEPQTGGAGQGKPGGFSRRAFLRGAGFSVAGTALLNSGLVGTAGAAGEGNSSVLGPGRVPIGLKVNGRAHRLAVEPRATLADTLRDELGLTGTKVVCDRGACSACTVFLDGTPACSCMTLAIEVGSREITTIEGLAQNGKLHPIQEAFVECDASMCGFLHARHGHELRGALEAHAAADARANSNRRQWQSLPLRHVSESFRSCHLGGKKRRSRVDG